MLQKQLESALPKIIDKLRSDLYQAEENLKSIGGPAPNNQREKVRKEEGYDFEKRIKGREGRKMRGKIDHPNLKTI